MSSKPGRWDPVKRVLFRIPPPYNVIQSIHPSNADEKLRTEAATFVWIQENCSNIPILSCEELDILMGKVYVSCYDHVVGALTTVLEGN